ncbi:MAG: accessory Sec system protein Asp1, partial [Lachnospiraceae bacterium]|nr:accessory Sec system protein Asp1 [Lachnospiraceae bacterium]
MYYFVPSWYAQKNSWLMSEKTWSQVGKAEFDDTVSQIRMFRKENEEVCLVQLAYAPQLRRYMHKQNIWPMETWSAFDLLQGLSGTEMALFSYHDLSFPEEIEWVYSSFAMLGYLEDRLYARLQYNDAGAIMQIDFCDHDRTYKRFHIDDRGLLSAVSYIENDIELKREFYNSVQQLQFTWDFETDQVKVEEDTVYPFRYRQYDSMNALLTEAFDKLARKMEDNDVLLLASNAQHNRLIMDRAKDHQTVLSFFGDRYDVEHEEDLQLDVNSASFLVTDTESLSKMIREHCEPGNKRIMDISPFDTRLSLGKSQQIKALKVFCPIDGMQEPIRTRALKQMLEVLQSDEKIQLILALKSPRDEDVGALRNEMKLLASELEGDRLIVENEVMDDGG